MARPPRLAVESIAGQRPYQEDSVVARTLPDGRTLVAVADGMGGHAAGEVASALALESLVAALEEGRALAEAFHHANERVHLEAREPGKQGMGTTLAAVLVEGPEFHVANVGDSRVYLISAGGIRRLTEDHSFVAEAMRRGQSEGEAMATPWRDALTRSIGTEEDVEVDVFGPFRVEDRSALLICSDGLYKTLSDAEVRTVFMRSKGTERAARSLVSAAYDGGSDDNISVAIAEFGEVPRESAATTMVLTYDPEAGGDGESDELSDPRADGAGAGAVEPQGALTREGALGGPGAPPSLPAAAVTAVVVLAGLLVAYLVFGG